MGMGEMRRKEECGRELGVEEKRRKVYRPIPRLVEMMPPIHSSPLYYT